jgi:hypothetical protein
MRYRQTEEDKRRYPTLQYVVGPINQPQEGYISGKVPFYDNRLHREVLEPRAVFCSFVAEKKCAMEYAAFYRKEDNPFDGKFKCKEQCALCKQVCEENDYVRGVTHKDKGHYPVPAVYQSFGFANWYNNKDKYWSEFVPYMLKTYGFV